MHYFNYALLYTILQSRQISQDGTILDRIFRSCGPLGLGCLVTRRRFTAMELMK